MHPCPILESGPVRHGLAARRRRRGDSFHEMMRSLERLTMPNECHPERSEGSRIEAKYEMLRHFAPQHDMVLLEALSPLRK